MQVQDYTAPLAEPKSKRKEISLKPSVAAAIKHAAALVGMDESTFISSAAYKKAKDVELAQFSSVLPEEQFAAFARAVDAPGSVSSELTAAIVRGRRLLKDE